MTCYSSIIPKENWKIKGDAELPQSIINKMKTEMNRYNLDWRWLAAMAWVESNWVTNVENSDKVHYGLLQFTQQSIGTGYDYKKVDDQITVAAQWMDTAYKQAIQAGLKGDECYQYCGFYHNAGSGAAPYILEKCGNNPSIANMQRIAQSITEDEIKRDGKPKNFYFLSKPSKHKEIPEYPVKMKTAYNDIIKKYDLNGNTIFNK